MTDNSIPLKRCGTCGRFFPTTIRFFVHNKRSPDGFDWYCKECHGKKFGIFQIKVDVPEGYKYCPKCKRILPSDPIYFGITNRRDGWQTYCRECRGSKFGIPENSQIINNGQKQCSKCKKWYPATDEYFIIESRMSTGFTSQCRKCTNESSANYYYEHPQKAKQSRALYRENNPEKRKQMNKRWAENNPEKRRLNTIRYRTRKRNLKHSFTETDWIRALDYFNHCCAICGRQLNNLFGNFTVAKDHWIPMDSPNCPGTIPTNIVPLCHQENGCNNKKKNYEPTEWLEREFGKQKAAQINRRIQTYFEWVREQNKE